MNLIKGFLILSVLVSLSFGENFNIDNIKKDVDVFKQLDFAEKMYQGNDFISKDDFEKLQTEINDIKNSVEKGPFSFLLYFTSSSVPNNTLMNVLHSLSILQDNNVRIFSKQYIMGPPEDFRDYMISLNDSLYKKFPNLISQEKVKRNFALKIDPRYFDYFKLKEAPAMALATCPALTPDVEKCKFHYLMRGDAGLVKFFDKISKEDKRYEKLVRILIANKIVDNEGK